MKKINLNINKILNYLVLFLLFSFIFYWFSYKPRQIRSNCSSKTQPTSIEGNEFIYKHCLRQNGLEK